MKRPNASLMIGTFTGRLLLQLQLQLSFSSFTSCDAAFRPSFSTQRPIRHNLQPPEKSITTTTTRCGMALLPLPVDALDSLLVRGVPTASQYSTYWGRTSRETYSNLMESAIVTFLGVILSYCLSFAIGGFVATVLGSMFAMWTLLSPELRAYQRNWELLGGRALVDVWTTDSEREGLYGALFLGVIQHVAVVEDSSDVIEYDFTDFADYTMESDELEDETGLPYLLRVRLGDSRGRSIQLHARMSEEYLPLEPGQSVAGILLSTSPKFAQLSALTDFVIPEAACWIGDYPYLERNKLAAYLNEELWEVLEDEQIKYGAEYPTNSKRERPASGFDMRGFGNDDDDYDFQPDMVPLPRRGRRGRL